MLVHTLETSLKSRMPFGEEESKVSRCVLFRANSAMNLSIAVVTSGESAQASKQERSVGRCAGYSHSNSKPAQALPGSAKPERPPNGTHAAMSDSAHSGCGLGQL